MKCFDPWLCYMRDKRKVFLPFSKAQKSPLLRSGPPAFVYNCGACLVCRKRRSVQLAARCVLHSSVYPFRNMFLTLTYDEKKEGYHNVFQYSDIQDFKKRLRQFVFRECGDRIEVFNVHEYGKNGKKHWHLLVFNYDFGDKEIHTFKEGRPLYTSRRLVRLWPHGFSTIGAIEEASAMYAAQYMEKDFKNGHVTDGKKAHSKHSGLGRPYFLQQYNQILRLGYVPFSGRRLPVFRYFERLAERHYAHFYDRSLFFDTRDRKARFRPFRGSESGSRDIANLFVQYKEEKQNKILELEAEFEEVISQYIDSKDVPDFVKSGSNAEYDQLKKITQERF